MYLEVRPSKKNSALFIVLVVMALFFTSQVVVVMCIAAGYLALFDWVNVKHLVVNEKYIRFAGKNVELSAIKEVYMEGVIWKRLVLVTRKDNKYVLCDSWRFSVKKIKDVKNALFKAIPEQ